MHVRKTEVKSVTRKTLGIPRGIRTSATHISMSRSPHESHTYFPLRRPNGGVRVILGLLQEGTQKVVAAGFEGRGDPLMAYDVKGG